MSESRTKGLDEKFCGSCGEVIKSAAEICVKCGVRQLPNQAEKRQAGSMARGSLPRLSPISAYGSFFCGVGILWTLASWFQLCGGVNKMNPEARLVPWFWFVPIYNWIYLSVPIDQLNNIISLHDLNVQPGVNNIVLNFLWPFIPFHRMFTLYNQVADALEGR